jgi:3-oxoacyl-[acyl-carrier-protein] synthase II
MSARVAVTGIGVVSGAGQGKDRFTKALHKGTRCFSELKDVPKNELRATHAAICDEVQVNPDDRSLVENTDRVVHLALIALREAVDSAGLMRHPGPRTALILGTCSGGMLSIEDHYRALNRGETRLSEALLFAKRYYTPAKVLACAVGAGGPVMSVVTACAASAGAVAQGADLIRSGLAETVLAGGADTFALSTLAGFDALKATCAGMSTPFSQNIGLNLGEGAAFLVLEQWLHARKRGATILAEIVGSGLSNDAYHATSPDPSTRGQVAAIERAMADAGLDPSHIDYVNAHGTGTRANDHIESRTLARILGERATVVPVSSTKSMIGHCLGAAGALEAAACILGRHAGCLPPTVGFTEPRDGCGLGDYVPEPGRSFEGRIALSNSFGFGGHNACLLMDLAPDEDEPLRAAARSGRRVRPVITGVGLVHALGLGAQPFVDTDASGIATVDRFETRDPSFRAGLVPPVDLRRVDRRLSLKDMDRATQYTTLAARLALGDAAIKARPSVTASVGLVLGLATGATQGETHHLNAFFESGFKLERVDAFPFVVQNAVAGHAARALMLKGYNTVLSQGWGAGLAALIASAVAISESHADAVIAAAADELTERAFLDGLAVGLFGPGTGVTPGEGAAALVVEDPDAAAARGAPKVAEVLGFAMATDVKNPRMATGEAIDSALVAAIDRAGVDPAAVQQVATSQSGGLTDAMEERAIQARLPNAKALSLVRRIGFSEAALPLFNLAYVLATSTPETLIACTSQSREGLASAAILMRL